MLCTTRAQAYYMYCCYCVMKGLSVAKKDAFVTSGFNNSKTADERFTQHTHSDISIDSLPKVELLLQGSVNILLHKQAMV